MQAASIHYPIHKVPIHFSIHKAPFHYSIHKANFHILIAGCVHAMYNLQGALSLSHSQGAHCLPVWCFLQSTPTIIPHASASPDPIYTFLAWILIFIQSYVNFLLFYAALSPIRSLRETVYPKEPLKRLVEVFRTFGGRMQSSRENAQRGQVWKEMEGAADKKRSKGFIPLAKADKSVCWCRAIALYLPTRSSFFRRDTAVFPKRPKEFSCRKPSFYEAFIPFIVADAIDWLSIARTGHQGRLL